MLLIHWKCRRSQKFEDLPVWQEAARLYNRVLGLLEEPNLPLRLASAINWIGPRFQSPTTSLKDLSEQRPRNSSHSLPFLGVPVARFDP